MKKTFFILSCTLLVVACSNSSDTKISSGKDTTANVSAAPPPANEKGLELIGSSDCTTCHRLHKDGAGASIGPAYSDVAAKYAPAADTTVDRLVKKVISGGSGVWGQIPMTAHAALPEADVREMVKYILSLKK